MRMISTRFSITRLLGIVRRHMRLLKRLTNDENLLNQIGDEYNALAEKQAIIIARSEERENAYDDVLLADAAADDSVRNVFAACKQHDRESPDNNVLIRIFPDEKFGEIVRLPFASEIMQLENLAVRIEGLGAEHPLAEHSEKLRSNAETVKTAIQNYEQTVHNLKLAEAEADITKESLIRKYEINYLEIRKKYGKRLAERAFPKSYTKPPEIEDEVDSAEQADAA